MKAEPVRPYIYQPDPPPEAFGKPRVANPKIYALGGPGTEAYRQKKFTFREAEDLLERINAAGKMESCCECGEYYPRVDLLDGHIYCSACRILPENQLCRR